jgi:hypothetical protein
MTGTIRYTVYGEEDVVPHPLEQLCELGNRGKLGTTVHRIEGQSSPWDRLCALEDDLIRASNLYNQESEGWFVVVGHCVMLDGVAGWLEYEDWVIVMCPPEYREEHETDVLVISRPDFEMFCPQIRACCPIGEDSGLRLNRALAETADLESLFDVAC